MHYLNCLDKVTNFEESKKILKDKGLVIKEYGDLYLVKYRKDKSDMKNEDVQTNLELTLKNIETFIKKIGDQTVPSPSQRRGVG